MTAKRCFLKKEGMKTFLLVSRYGHPGPTKNDGLKIVGNGVSFLVE